MSLLYVFFVQRNNAESGNHTDSVPTHSENPSQQSIVDIRSSNFDRGLRIVSKNGPQSGVTVTSRASFRLSQNARKPESGNNLGVRRSRSVSVRPGESRNHPRVGNSTSRTTNDQPAVSQPKSERETQSKLPSANTQGPSRGLAKNGLIDLRKCENVKQPPKDDTPSCTYNIELSRCQLEAGLAAAIQSAVGRVHPVGCRVDERKQPVKETGRVHPRGCPGQPERDTNALLVHLGELKARSEVGLAAAVQSGNGRVHHRGCLVNSEPDQEVQNIGRVHHEGCEDVELSAGAEKDSLRPLISSLNDQNISPRAKFLSGQFSMEQVVEIPERHKIQIPQPTTVNLLGCELRNIADRFTAASTDSDDSQSDQTIEPQLTTPTGECQQQRSGNSSGLAAIVAAAANRLSLDAVVPSPPALCQCTAVRGLKLRELCSLVGFEDMNRNVLKKK